mgnify:CR=1 FL=1
MLNYGVDPLYGEAQNGLGFRTLSLMKLPFIKMCGGYASHFGIDPKYFTTKELAHYIIKEMGRGGLGYKIKFEDNAGWVSGKYSEKL